MTIGPVSATHQTVRLARGRHESPEDGACVMELVSMLAGEPFSDGPATACPVIATFLRTYNDVVRDASRQELLACASRVVDSRCPAVEPARIARCHALAVEISRSRPWWWRGLAWVTRWPAVSRRSAPPRRGSLAFTDLCTRLSVLLRSEPDGGPRTVALVEELVAMGEAARVAEAAITPELDVVQVG